MTNRDTESARAIRKQLNASERQRGKREIREQLSEEDCNYIERSIKEYYMYGKMFTEKLAYTLRRLDISIFENDYDYGYELCDIEFDFVEKVFPAPKGWKWHYETIDRDPYA